MAVKKDYILINPHLRTGAVRKRLLAVMSDKETMREVHKKLKEFVEPFVPMDSGNLRAHARALPSGVVYETPYANYQYQGDVWGPNIPIIKGGTIVGWKDTPMSAKHPMGWKFRKTPVVWRGWRFGYKTSGTTYQWMEEAFKGGGKARFSKQATRVMKARARRLNKKW